MPNKIIIQVSRNVQILIRETFIYMTMDAEHSETNPTITFQLLHEDFDIHITYIQKTMRKYASYNLDLEMFIYIKMDAESNETTPAISVPLFHEDIPRVHEYSCIFPKKKHQNSPKESPHRQV